jgi:uncharacterized DUF497 family protein
MPEHRAFEWDDAKALSNLTKHSVSFSDAIRVFRDPRCIELDTSRALDRESRRKAIGVIQGRHFTVVYTIRDGVTRIISARRCNPTEKKLYGSFDG